MAITATQIKNLRDLTGAGVMETKKALEEANGDTGQAKSLLKEWGVEKAAKKEGRATAQGLIHAYIHHGGKIGSLVEVLCETDFVARTEDFSRLVHEIAMQAAALDSSVPEELLESDYIRDPNRKIKDLVTEVIAKVGENIKVSRIVVFKV